MDDMTEIKTTLGHIMGMLSKVDARFDRLEAGQADLKADLAELKGRMNDAPTARDFGRIEGRLDEISNRLPVSIAYQPPGKRAAER